MFSSQGATNLISDLRCLVNFLSCLLESHLSYSPYSLITRALPLLYLTFVLVLVLLPVPVAGVPRESRFHKGSRHRFLFSYLGCRRFVQAHPDIAVKRREEHLSEVHHCVHGLDLHPRFIKRSVNGSW